MKIAFILGGFPRISETWVLAQVTALLDRGHEVDLYARRSSRQPIVHADVTAYDLMRRTHYFDVPMTSLGRVLRAAGVLARNLPNHLGAMVRCLNLPRYGSFYAVLNNVMFVEPFLDRRYDAILCHFGGNGIDFIALKDVFPNTRFITMFHGDDYFIGDEKGPEIFDLLKHLGDAFLVTTDCFGRATLRRYGFDDARIVTLRLALAVKNVPFRDARPDDGSLRLLSVARLVEKKGLDVGIRAVAALQASQPGLRVKYRIIGDGPLHGELTSLVRTLGAERTVHLLGPAPSAEVLRWMHESDIYLLPSLMEQAGYVLLEAQATGLPVVASRVGGVPEMVREGRSALLVEPGDAAGITVALQRLLERRPDWPAMANEGRSHVEEHHDVDRLTAQLETVLRGSAAMTGSASPAGVLFIENSVGLSGSTISLCALLNHLDEAAFRPHVVVSRPEQAQHLRSHLRGSIDIEVIAPGSGFKGARWLQRALGAAGGRAAWLKRLARRIIASLDVVAVTIPYALRLRRFARHRGIALVHQNNGFDLGAIILARLLRVPLIAYQRGPEWDSPTVRRLAPTVRRYIANSAATRENLLSLGIPADRVSIIYPPLDLGVFDHRRPAALGRSAFGLDTTTPCFGIVGMLLPWKGHAVFLRAARRVLHHLPNARAFVVGGPPAGGEKYEVELKGLAQELGIADRVIFTGFRADVPEMLNLLDVAVHASVSPEPFGRVIVEAMAMRRPVVASGAGGPLEIIEDNRNGFLVPPGDDEALASRVIALLEDPALSARIAEAAYHDVVRRFSAEPHARDVQQIYQTVLHPEAGAGAQERRADQVRRSDRAQAAPTMPCPPARINEGIDEEKTDPVDVSILIPTYNGRDVLARLLQSLRDAEPAQGFKWEIIVIDNNSPDDTKSVIESFRASGQLDVACVFEPEPGKTRALNRGLAEAAGTFVAFLDHDAVVERDYLVELHKAIRTQPYNVFGGRVIPVWPSTPPAWVTGGKRLQTSWGGVIVHDYGDKPLPYTSGMALPVGCNFICRRTLFDAVGQFNVHLGPRPGAAIAGEETELLWRIQALGETILYTPSIQVFHPVDPARLSKSYLRYRYFCDGRTVARINPADPTMPTFFGVRRFLFRQILESAAKGLWAACRGDQLTAFYCQLDVCYVLGSIYESRHAARKGLTGN